MILIPIEAQNRGFFMRCIVLPINAEKRQQKHMASRFPDRSCMWLHESYEYPTTHFFRMWKLKKVILG